MIMESKIFSVLKYHYRQLYFRYRLTFTHIFVQDSNGSKPARLPNAPKKPHGKDGSKPFIIQHKVLKELLALLQNKFADE